MPTYQDALSANPSEFLSFASEMTAAAADLATQQTDYGTKVSEINSHWQDTANDAFNGEVGNVNTHLSQVIGEVTATAGSLASTAAQMLMECTGLKAADAALKAVGFNIQPAPLVTLGPAQRTAIAMAGPFGSFIEAGLQVQAMAGTLGLQTLTSLVNAADATAGAALTTAADLLKPLDDKANPTGKDLESHAMAEDHSSGGTEDSGGQEAASEEESKEEEEEKQEEEAAESEQDKQQESTQPESQQPTTPETPAGMEDMTQPEIPELDDPFDPSELEAPEGPSGGLASGGGGAGGGIGGGGVPSGGVPSSGGGMGAATMVGAQAAGTAAGSGGKTGTGMMGAGGGRGAGGQTGDEVERESFLTEDPDEDVWGIGKAADDRFE